MKINPTLVIILLTGYVFASRTLPTHERMIYYGSEVPRISEEIGVKGKPKTIRWFEIAKDGDTVLSFIKYIDSTQTTVKTYWYNRKNKIESWKIDCYDNSGRMLSTRTIMPDSTIRWETEYLISDNNRRVKKVCKVPIDKIEKEIKFTEYDSVSEIITLDSNGKCSEKEIRYYNEGKRIVRMLGFTNNCKDTSHLVKLEYENGRIIKDRNYYFGRKGRQHQYTFEFIYDSNGLLIERRFWTKNLKKYVTDKYSYDSLGRKIKEEWIGITGKVYESSIFQYEGTKQIRTIKSDRNKKVYTKFIEDTTIGYEAIEEYNRRNDKPLYYRKVNMVKDKNGNWVEMKTLGFIRGPFWIKRNWERIIKREIEYW